MALNPDGGTDPLPPVDQVVTPSEPLPVPPIPPKNLPPNVNSVAMPSDGVVSTGGRLWMRKWELSVGNAAGDKAEDLSHYDFEFTVTQQMFQNSWSARIKIWNLGEKVVSRLVSTEFQAVLLKAGYQTPSQQYGRLFAGEVNYFKHGRQNATDTYLEIFAMSSDIAINATIINTWLNEGHSTKDQVTALVDPMKAHGASVGTIPEKMSKDSAPRGRLLYGNPRDHLRTIARTANGQQFTDKDGKVHILTEEEMRAAGNQKVVILDVNTGMVDVPTRTIDGAVEVVSLLNPAINPGGWIKIDNEKTSGYKQGNTAPLPDAGKQFQEASFIFNVKGLYPIGHVRHEGQTRGNAWHSHIVCLRAVPEAPLPPTTLGT